MKNRVIKKRKIYKDTWDMSFAFMLWLRERLVVFEKEAGKIVDLEFHKIVYKGEEITLKGAIDKMISILNAVNWHEFDFMVEGAKAHEVLELFNLTIDYLWW